MKNIVKLFGVIALVALIGFSMAACGGDDGCQMLGVRHHMRIHDELRERAGRLEMLHGTL
jgi:hypothetical protein